MTSDELRTKDGTPSQRAIHAYICAMLREDFGHCSAVELLAIASQIVGQLIALQDQRTMTTARAMDIVIGNIEAGNARAFAVLDKPEGSA